MQSYFTKSVFLCATLILFVFAPVFGQKNAPDLSKQVALVSEFEVNGLKVLFKRRANSPTVAAGLFVRGGARNLTADNSGIESFALNVATEASKKFPKSALRRELARTGTGIGAGASYDFSVVSLGTTRANFDRSWEIFTDLLLNPTFAPEDVERLRAQVLSGLREQTSDADSYLSILQDKAVFNNHVYANSPRGTEANITKFKTDELKDYQRSLLQTSRLLLVIVGDLEIETLKAKISESFGALPRGNYQEKAVPALTFTAPSVEVFARNLPTNYVQGTYAAPSPNDKDIHAMRVATTILQQRVFREVRDERNLSYAPTASIDNRAANTGGIYVSAVDANQSVSIMLDEIEKLQNETVDAENIEGVVGQDLTVYYLKQETNAAQVADLATNELIGGGWRNAFAALEQTRKVTPADVRRVAQKYMKNIKFVVLGNPQYINREIFTRQAVKSLEFK